MAPLRQAILIRRRQAAFRDRAHPGRVQAAKEAGERDGIHRPQRPGRPDRTNSLILSSLVNRLNIHNRLNRRPCLPIRAFSGKAIRNRALLPGLCLFQRCRLLPPRQDTRRQRQPCSGGWAISLSGRGANTCSTCWNPSIGRWRSPGWP